MGTRGGNAVTRGWDPTTVRGPLPFTGSTFPSGSSHHEERHHRHTPLEAEPHACVHRQWLPSGVLRQELGQCLSERLRLLEVRQVRGRGENHQCGAGDLLLDGPRRGDGCAWGVLSNND